MDPVALTTGLLVERGYRVDAPPVAATAFALRQGHSAGWFLPYVDYIFIHDFGTSALDSIKLERLHQQARDYAATQFRLQPLMRYRIPNVVTLGLGWSFSAEAVACARKSRMRINAGEKHSVHLIDLGNRQLYSPELEQNPERYGGHNTSSINPTNRIIRMIAELAEEVLASVDEAPPTVA